MDAVMVTCAVFAVGGSIVSYLFFVAIKRAAEQAVSFADDARLFAEEAESERRRVLTIKEEMEQRVVGLEAWAKSLVEKLEGTEYMAVESAEKARVCRDDARATARNLDTVAGFCREQSDKVADIAEVVKLEVAKIETIIAKLNKDRAENPPFVAITYGEESGEPEKAEVSIEEKKFADGAVKIINEHRDEILKAIEDMKTFNYEHPYMPNLWPGLTTGHLVVDQDGRVKSCGTQDVAHTVALDPEPCGGTITTLPAGQPFEFKPTQVHPVVTEGGE